jgi:raffinose/stachyose/melibiose transport system substrate-binding protein
MLRRMSTCRVAKARGILAIAITAAIAASLAGAATVQAKGSSAPSKKATTTLRVATINTAAAAWEALAKNYEAANPNVDVQLEYWAVQTFGQTLATQLQGGHGPDVISGLVGGRGQINSVLNLASAGRLADLTKEKWVQRVPEQARPLFTVGKKMYALPLALNTSGLVYNTDLLQQLGVKIPKTFSGLLALCRKVKDRVVPVAVGAGIWNNAGAFGSLIASSTVYAGEPTWTTKRMKGSVTFAGSNSWLKVLQQVQQMKEAGCFAPDVAGMGLPQVFGLLATGKALMWTGPSIAIGQASSLSSKLNLAQAPFPGLTVAGTRAMVGYVDGAAVNNASKNLTEAKKFVSFLAREGQSRLYAKVTTSVSLHDVNVVNLPVKLKEFGPYLKAKKTVSNPYLEWINAESYVTFANAITGILSGQVTNLVDALSRIDASWSKGPS